MNFNKDLFEKAEAKEFGDFEVLELGGHELVILDAREYTSEVSGNTSLKVSVDIAGMDKQAGFFKKQYDENTNPEKKWPNGAVKYLSLKDEQIEYLKGFITAVENSNKGFKFDDNGTWEQLKGKKIAGQFGLEEYIDSENKIRTATKLLRFRSLTKLGEITIPSVKTIDGDYVDYDDYMETRRNNNSNDVAIEIPDDALPF